MDEMLEAKRQNRLRRSGRQLLLAKEQVETHPLLEEKFQILAVALQHLYWQSLWTSAKEGARLLMSCQMALFSHHKNESRSGLWGPLIGTGRKALAVLVECSLKMEEREMGALLIALAEVMAVGSLYIEAELAAEARRMRGGKSAKESVSFAKELALSFLLTAQLPQKLFSVAGEGLGLDEKSRKRARDVALFGVLLFILLVEREPAKRAELFPLIAKHALPLLPSVEEAVELADWGSSAMAQVELLKRSFEEENSQAFEELVETMLELVGLSPQDWQREADELGAFSYALSDSFANVFYQSGVRSTSMMQTA